MTPRSFPVARRLKNLAAHPWRRQALAAEALGTLVAARIVVAVLPFRQWRRWAAEAAPVEPEPPEPARIDDILWAVDRASRPLAVLASCLPRACAATRMLRRRGVAATLCFGVERGSPGTLRAHAWVEFEGRVLIGGVPDLDRFTRLATWPAAGAR